MNKRTLAALVLALCALVAVWAVRVILQARRDGGLVLYDSALQTLVNDTHEELRLYRTEHGRYPQSLHDLHFSKHGDEYCESMMKDVVYKSDGATYTLERGTNRYGYAEYEAWRRKTY